MPPSYSTTKFWHVFTLTTTLSVWGVVLGKENAGLRSEGEAFRSQVNDYSSSSANNNNDDGDGNGECGSALLDLAETLLLDDHCTAFLDDIANFFTFTELPTTLPLIDLDARGDLTWPSLNFSVPEPPSLDLDTLCDAGQCISKITASFANLEEACTASDMQVFTEKATRYVKIVRAVIATACVQDENEKYCLVNLLTGLYQATDPLALLQRDGGAVESSSPSLGQVRETLCSSCSANLQADLYPVFDVPSEFATLVDLLCIDETAFGSGDDNFCSVDSLSEAFKYSVSPSLFSIFQDETGLCDENACETQAIALLTWLTGTASLPEECLEPETLAEEAVISFNFKDIVIPGDDYSARARIENAIQDDLALALRVPIDFVRVRFWAHRQSFEVTVTDRRVIPESSPSESDLEQAITTSPFLNTNVIQGITEDPTATLQVSDGVTDSPTTAPTSSPTTSPTGKSRIPASVIVTTAMAGGCILSLLVILLSRHTFANGDDDSSPTNTDSSSSCCGCCCPVKHPCLITAQALSIIALIGSFTSWVGFALALLVFVPMQVLWCAKLKSWAVWAIGFACLLPLVTAVVSVSKGDEDELVDLFLRSFGFFAIMFWTASFVLTVAFLLDERFANKGDKDDSIVTMDKNSDCSLEEAVEVSVGPVKKITSAKLPVGWIETTEATNPDGSKTVTVIVEAGAC